MNAWMKDRGLRRAEMHRRHAAQSLKRCPLCNTLNARQNAECVTCRWYGEFESDPFLIEEGLDQMMRRCPEFAEDFLSDSRATGAAGPLTRVLTLVTNLWRRVLRCGLRRLYPSG
ncbi:MAG: hypothetical protein HZC36_02350 [Armatimonadetes bacterium]|nr:hypothetical protein [Armatimonadota bacterium]